MDSATLQQKNVSKHPVDEHSSSSSQLTNITPTVVGINCLYQTSGWDPHLDM